jgi:trk system potassium uptake protein TrkA
VGFYLAKEFIQAGHEVLVIEPDSKRREWLEEELGDVTVGGEGCRIQCLDEAGVSRADVFIAATDVDEDNLAASQLAKLKYHVPRVVAKVNNPRNRNTFRKLGVEHTIDVASLVFENLKAQIPLFPFSHLLSLEGEDVEVVQVRVTETSSLHNRKLGESPLAFLAGSACLVRAGAGPQVASESTVMLSGDTLVCVIPHGWLEKLRAVVEEPVAPVV